MRKINLFLVFGVSFLLIGCATTKKHAVNTESEDLKNQVSVLETQLQEKDTRISELESQLQGAQAKSASEQVAPIAKEVMERPTARQIQVALQKAGFDPGIIDGRIGKKTREAISAFQVANGLVADGRVGKDTWAKLKEYLTKRIK